MADLAPTRPRLLIDCDPGVDDAVMLVCAAAYADVVAVTTVNGNVGLDLTTRNALAVTELLGWHVPVHAGAARALLAGPVAAAEVHGDTGRRGADLPEPTRTAGTEGIEVLIEATRAEEGLSLLATGPLTNVALALRADDGMARRLAGICLMGGSALGGNVTAAAEFNLYADPEAAAVVFGTDCAVRMCGLDLTHQVTTSPAFATQVRAVGGPAAALVAGIVDAQLATFGQYATSTAEPPLHDPVALLALTHPHLFAATTAPIHVETAGIHARGATVVDRRLLTPGGDPPGATGVRTEWVHTVDAPAALALVVDACRCWA